MYCSKVEAGKLAIGVSTAESYVSFFSFFVSILLHCWWKFKETYWLHHEWVALDLWLHIQQGDVPRCTKYWSLTVLQFDIEGFIPLNALFLSNCDNE